MFSKTLSFFAIVLPFVPVSVGSVPAAASVASDVRHGLEGRYPPSRMEVANAPVEGRVSRRSAILTLQAKLEP